MPRLNTIAKLRAILIDELKVPVFVSVPLDAPNTYLVIRREGGALENFIVDRVGVGVSAYANSEQEAFELASRASDVMTRLHRHKGFLTVSEQVFRSDYDLVLKKPRWYGSYTIKTYKQGE